jgi:diketogulonate reductase-like aldo/keto reductase
MQIVEANGAKIPAVGLGTWLLNGSLGSRITEQALKLGYRHLDCALIYGNEREVGEGLHASGVKRDGCVHHHQGAAHRAGAGRARARREAEPCQLRVSDVTCC